MKRPALGPLFGLALFSLVAGALAQVPSGSTRPGRTLGAHPGPGASGAHPRGKPFSMMTPHGSAAPAGSGTPGTHTGLRQRMLERMATRKARRETHVAQLQGRFSQFHLKNEALREELRRHARSLAFLTRARLIAEEELTDPKKAKVLERIEVLLAKEKARHDRHILRFTGVGPAPSGSARPFASGFVPPRAPSAAASPPGSGPPKRKPSPAASAGGAR